MFRDTQEALERLQEQLLEDEEDQMQPDIWPDETRAEDTPRVYQNFSNNYGRSLRNFATGYKAYNADTTDTDLDSYSEIVREPPKRRPLLWIPVTLIILATAVVILALWLYARQGGLI